MTLVLSSTVIEFAHRSKGHHPILALVLLNELKIVRCRPELTVSSFQWIISAIKRNTGCV